MAKRKIGHQNKEFERLWIRLKKDFRHLNDNNLTAKKLYMYIQSNFIRTD